MTQYSIALEQKMAFVRTMAREGARVIPDAAFHKQALRLFTDDCPVYYWKAHIAEAVLKSSDSLPDDSTAYPAGTSPNGWMWFERPFAPGLMSKRTPASGLYWITNPIDRALAVTTLGFEDGDPVLGELNTCILQPGFTLREIDRQLQQAKGARFWVAAALWMQQTIIVAEPTPADRATRRRLERLGTPASPINVVQLRRTAYAGIKPQSPTEPKEWTCQWLVRGHWRQQYYPSTGENRPLWILPYVKGPEGAPLKTPAPTVFAVTR